MACHIPRIQIRSSIILVLVYCRGPTWLDDHRSQQQFFWEKGVGSSYSRRSWYIRWNNKETTTKVSSDLVKGVPCVSLQLNAWFLLDIYIRFVSSGQVSWWSGYYWYHHHASDFTTSPQTGGSCLVDIKAFSSVENLPSVWILFFRVVVLDWSAYSWVLLGSFLYIILAKCHLLTEPRTLFQAFLLSQKHKLTIRDRPEPDGKVFPRHSTPAERYVLYCRPWYLNTRAIGTFDAGYEWN